MLVVGAAGMLGQDVVRAAGAGAGAPHAELDVTDAAAVARGGAAARTTS